MTLRKISDAPVACHHPEHNPPGMIVLSPGTYEHACPGCGKSVVFTVGGITCESAGHPGTTTEYFQQWEAQR